MMPVLSIQPLLARLAFVFCLTIVAAGATVATACTEAAFLLDWQNLARGEGFRNEVPTDWLRRNTRNGVSPDYVASMRAAEKVLVDGLGATPNLTGVAFTALLKKAHLASGYGGENGGKLRGEDEIPELKGIHSHLYADKRLENYAEVVRSFGYEPVKLETPIPLPGLAIVPEKADFWPSSLNGGTKGAHPSLYPLTLEQMALRLKNLNRLLVEFHKDQAKTAAPLGARRDAVNQQLAEFLHLFANAPPFVSRNFSLAMLIVNHYRTAFGLEVQYAGPMDFFAFYLAPAEFEKFYTDYSNNPNRFDRDDVIAPTLLYK